MWHKLIAEIGVNVNRFFCDYNNKHFEQTI